MLKQILFLFLIGTVTSIATASEDVTNSNDNQNIFQKGNIKIEVSIDESPEGSVIIASTFEDGKAFIPDYFSIELQKLGSTVEEFEFQSSKGVLRSTRALSEPHSFNATIYLTDKKRKYSWEWENLEGRTQIAKKLIEKSQLATSEVQSGTIERHVELLGTLVIPPKNKAEVNARFSGVVETLVADVGDSVNAGDVIAKIQSNDSLQTYIVKAPISGTVVSRNVNVGQLVAGETLYDIVDANTLWAELKVFPSKRDTIKPGSYVHIKKGSQQQDAQVKVLIPSSSQSPYQIAIVEIDNIEGVFSPGDMVTGVVDAQKIAVSLRVENEAIQSMDGNSIVFLHYGNMFQAVPVKLGIKDDNFTEIKHGLEIGQVYVSKNSFLIKADLEKSGASHAH
ncbi:HelB protein [Alteromonas macleodii str. 'Black Sea 11']|uniref:efflux RND transporter periplasmic adaptor subunit n=1 Tax=Alteromonas abrolhosensis TaxID=1892904 RepID=UPI000286F6DA|nr:HelB protein [Alteromonas macleodii str. 'Black Sea 11']NKW88548.1 HlyD family efflux transporter periplasmic adaptor subunit [Alteromonadaceae bacterium A_SAG4]NKX03529.1 HlyD family efflux transporter periplasmic adaptor subunit [Alteromonadaceae bacterium A_SAG6]NKX17770.1 HlyD family efflux transporter periplasmic adaptor subunit [Alteromonadaceae bacterium A_SAG5]NKX19120.1 HlyD family efflux transporter periplasmic adaptor subunit [Alteromonadaceae bacterium A_SAG8]NKX32881.1 HlyD fam